VLKVKGLVGREISHASFMWKRNFNPKFYGYQKSGLDLCFQTVAVASILLQNGVVGSKPSAVLILFTNKGGPADLEV